MEPRAARREEPVEEPVRPDGLDDLDGATALEAPRGPPESAAGSAGVRDPPEAADQRRERVDRPPDPDRDVVELRRQRRAHRPCSVRHARRL